MTQALLQQLMQIVLNGPKLAEEAKCEEIIERAVTYWACKQRRNVVIPGARTSLNIQWANTLNLFLGARLLARL